MLFVPEDKIKDVTPNDLKMVRDIDKAFEDIEGMMRKSILRISVLKLATTLLLLILVTIIHVRILFSHSDDYYLLLNITMLSGIIWGLGIPTIIDCIKAIRIATKRLKDDEKGVNHPSS